MSDKKKSQKDIKQDKEYAREDRHRKYDDGINKNYLDEDRRSRFRKGIDKDADRRNKLGDIALDKVNQKKDKSYRDQRDRLEDTKRGTNEDTSNFLEGSLQDDGSKYNEGKKARERSKIKGAGGIAKGDNSGLAKEVLTYGASKYNEQKQKDEDVSRRMQKLQGAISDYERDKDNPNKQQDYMKQIRDSIEMDLSKAVEREKAEYMAFKAANNERVTARELEKIEKKHKRAKSKNMSKDAVTVIKHVRSSESKQEFKAFMNSSEMRILLGLVSFFGGAVGSGAVLGIRLFAALWGLNFVIVAGVLVTLMLTIFFVLIAGVSMLILFDGTGVGEETEEVAVGGEEGEAPTSGSVEVPPGYENKVMLSVDRVMQTSRGLNSGHRGWDIASGGGGPDIYPMYPGTVIHTAKGKRQCTGVNNAGDQCSTFDTTNNCMFSDGNSVVIMSKIGGKNVLHYYMHMQANSVVADEGQKVGYGTKLGKMGSTGSSTGEHLHLEVWDGTPDYKPGVAPCTVGSLWDSAPYIAPQPLVTCGGKSGVMANGAGIPQSCVEDAKKARSK